jgi:uncharacterized protein YgiM (DUF1202 family)
MRPSTIVLIISLCFALTAHAEDFFSIQTRKVALREEPQFLSTVISNLEYSTKVTQLESRGSWSKVQAKDQSGWIPASALTEKNIAIKLESAKPEAQKKPSFGFGSLLKPKKEMTQAEVAMAGKAWESDIPLSGKVNYQAVDAMESEKIPLKQVLAYLENLKQGGQK